MVKRTRVTSGMVVWKVLLGFLMLSAGQARAADELCLEVYQPLLLDRGVCLCRVAYTTQSHDMWAGREVPFVAKPNCVMDDTGEARNLNAANILGIIVGVDSHHLHGLLYGDTLRVFVDLSAMRVPPGAQGQMANYTPRNIVEATVECVLTAAASFPVARDPVGTCPIKLGYIQLEVRGSQEYAYLGGVHPVDTLGELPRERWFQ
jgi:hypothetical protein